MKKVKFLDTNILLSNQINQIIDEDEFYISSITLKELESIKTSKNKDLNVKYQARKITRWLEENEDKWHCVIVKNEENDIIEKFKLPETNDNLIIASAYSLTPIYDVEFWTNDICCKNIAKKVFNLSCCSLKENKNNSYKGYIIKQFTDEELADFYSSYKDKNIYGLFINEYLIIQDSFGKYIDCYKWNGEILENVRFNHIQSEYFGEIKALDRFQMCALNSLQANQITMLKGKAGSGKSYLAIGYLMSLLEKEKIEKIIIFTNPVATKDSAILGYYSGNRDEKLLQSSIGNFLISKFGGRIEVETLIKQNKLILLPLSDLRGYDTTGMRAGVYITEAQNMSIELMKLALQRIGKDSICIVDGDYNTQIDGISFEGENNGMRRMSEVFKGHSIYGEIELQKIHRSEIAEIADEM